MREAVDQLCADAPELDDLSPADRGASTGESLARLSVTLPRSLYRQVRLHALDQDTTLSALLARLIRKELG
ncbi:MAG: hypothetical protein WAM11_15560 [Cyanobium sp.]